MKKFKQISIIILSFIISLSSFNISSAKGITNKAMREKVGCSKDNFDRILAVVDVMKVEGYSDAAIAGALGNSWNESHWNPQSEGMWGLDDTKSNWVASKSHRNCSHLNSDDWCKEGTCTTAFAMSVMKGDFDTYANARKNYSKFVNKSSNQAKIKNYKPADSGFCGKKYCTDYKAPESYDDFKSGSDPYHACISWCITMEVCAGCFLPCGFNCKFDDGKRPATINDMSKKTSSAGPSRPLGDWFLHEFSTDSVKNGRPAKAGVVYKWLTGGAYKSSENGEASETTKSTAVKTAKELVASGYWTEEQLSSYLKLSELNLSSYLEDANLDNLENNDPDSLNSINDWQNNIESQGQQGSVLYILRKIVSLLGILFTVWVILIYLAFWFDRTNSLFDVDMLGLLTFHRLVLSPEDDNCTFSLRELGKQDKRTVNHKAILQVCMLGLIFGVMLITGKIYDIIRGAVNLMFRIIEILF